MTPPFAAKLDHGHDGDHDLPRAPPPDGLTDYEMT